MSSSSLASTSPPLTKCQNVILTLDPNPSAREETGFLDCQKEWKGRSGTWLPSHSLSHFSQFAIFPVTGLPGCSFQPRLHSSPVPPQGPRNHCTLAQHEHQQQQGREDGTIGAGVAKRGKAGRILGSKLSNECSLGLLCAYKAKEGRETLILNKSFEVKQHTVSLGRTEEVCLGRVGCTVRRWGAGRGELYFIIFLCSFSSSILNSRDAANQGPAPLTIDTTVPPRGQAAIVLSTRERPGLKLMIPVPPARPK